jgi:hypothetical protein
VSKILTLDKTGGRERTGASSRPLLQNIQSQANLKDVFRTLNPDSRSFTFFSHSANVHSRLDRFYISDLLKSKVTRSRHIAVPRCDHRGCGFNIRLLITSRGRGYWKCNVSILHDPHFRDDFFALTDRISATLDDINPTWETWEEFKLKAKTLILTHATRVSVNRQVQTALLLKRLNFLYEIEAQQEGLAKDEINKINADLQIIAEKVKEGNIIRAKLKDLENTENSAEFYKSIETNKATDKHIEALNIGGNLCTDTPLIINHCLNYYSDLYNKREVDRSVWPTLTKNLTKLTEEEKMSCEGPFTQGECWTAISQMANNKSPGSDGLPAEFYKEFFPNIGPLFIKIANAQVSKILSPLNV